MSLGRTPPCSPALAVRPDGVPARPPPPFAAFAQGAYAHALVLLALECLPLQLPLLHSLLAGQNYGDPVASLNNGESLTLSWSSELRPLRLPLACAECLDCCPIATWCLHSSQSHLKHAVDTFACTPISNAPPALLADLHSVWRIPSADCPATFAEGPSEIELMPPSNGATGTLRSVQAHIGRAAASWQLEQASWRQVNQTLPLSPTLPSLPAGGSVTIACNSTTAGDVSCMHCGTGPAGHASHSCFLLLAVCLAPAVLQLNACAPRGPPRSHIHPTWVEPSLI